MGFWACSLQQNVETANKIQLKTIHNVITSQPPHTDTRAAMDIPGCPETSQNIPSRKGLGLLARPGARSQLTALGQETAAKHEFGDSPLRSRPGVSTGEISTCSDPGMWLRHDKLNLRMANTKNEHLTPQCHCLPETPQALTYLLLTQMSMVPALSQT